MRRILVIAALLSACAPTAAAPALDDTPAPVTDSIAAIGPRALCEDPTKLRSERGAEGPTVYYCAD